MTTTVTLTTTIAGIDLEHDDQASLCGIEKMDAACDDRVRSSRLMADWHI
jgi:hypothetical protein